MPVITMQTMRYINLLDRTSRVKTTNCFIYNGAIFFAVPGYKVSQAIGPNAVNVKELQDKLKRRIRIIKEPNGIESVHSFVQSIVEPVRFKSVETNDNEIIITAGNKQRKAILFGRNKQRFEELKDIVSDFFKRELKIV